MTWVAPTSARMAADTSPVWAPAGSGWQSCAPMRRADPLVRATAGAISGDRRADQNVDTGPGVGLRDLVKFVQLPDRPVHLPVACCQSAPHVISPQFSLLLSSSRDVAGQSAYMSLNLINSPHPQASDTLGLLNLKPDSRRLVS